MTVHPRHYAGQSGASDLLGAASDFLGSIPGPYQAGQGLAQGAADLYHAAQDAAGQIPTASSISAAQQTIQQQSASAVAALQNANANATQQSANVQAAAAQASQQMTTVIVLAAIGIVAAVYLTRK